VQWEKVESLFSGERDDLERFFKKLYNLALHMTLSEPEVTIGQLDSLEIAQERYSSKEHYCVDGFPKEGLPSLIVLPAPRRDGYVYQAIKPTVLVLQEGQNMPRK